MTEPTEEMALQEWVHTGKVILSNKKPGLVFRPIVNGQLADEKYYDTKGMPRVSVGGVYQVKASGTKIVPSSFKWLRTWEDTGQVAVWQTEARAFDTELRTRKQEKSETSVQHMLEVLAPLRKAYNRTNHIGRLAIEVQVLAYLRSYRIDLE